jgi:hypothetical protein
LIPTLDRPAKANTLHRSFKATISREIRAPFAVIGDFNGDGQKDVVVSGHSGRFSSTLCIFGGCPPRVISVFHSKIKSNSWSCLQLRHPGIIKNDWEPNPLNLRTDGFESVYWGKAATLNYWKNGRFYSYTTAD